MTTFLLCGISLLTGLGIASFAFLRVRRNVPRRGVVEPKAVTLPKLESDKQPASDLETISQKVRVGLYNHQANVRTFQERIGELSQHEGAISGAQLRTEAERILRPTMQLADQMTIAFDELLQQTNSLMMLSQIRIDPLTGLSNRKALDEALRNHFAMFSRYGNKFSVIMFDVDHIKKINDERGLLQGDQVCGIL